MKPIIGIPSDQLIEVNPRMPDDHPAYAPHDVKEAIYAGDGIPIIIPFPDRVNACQKAAKEQAQFFDGLLLPGGPDVDPLYYDEDPVNGLGMTLSAKDEFEIALIKETLAAGKPIFGICRGIQILNVALGGTLYQDLPSQNKEATIQHTQATLGHYPTHRITLTAQSKLAELFGDKIVVNSRHHQAVKKVAPGLKVTATAADGVIEAVESATGDQILAVQWHPENLWQKDPEQFKLFADFIERTKNYQEAREAR